MFHRVIKMEILDGTSLELIFQDGKVIRYDVAQLFDKYPALKALKNRKIFTTAKMTAYGVRWNDDLDLAAETVYEDGKIIRVEDPRLADKVAFAVKEARMKAGLSQSKLAELTGIDQGDISKIECGIANPSLVTLGRIAKTLNQQIDIIIK